VVQRLQHQRAVEAGVGKGDLLRARALEAQALGGGEQVLRQLPLVDLQPHQLGVGVPLQQRARQRRRAAAGLQQTRALQRHQGLEKGEFVVDQVHGPDRIGGPGVPPRFNSTP
jgi:hypothetical protein